MDSLQNLLNQYSPTEPDEILLAKRYIEEQFRAPSSVALKGEAIVITVASAALANTLRLRMPKLRAACNTTKRFVFRIG